MPVGIIGQKCGMTRVFTEAGESIPVTVIKVQSHRVTQIKDSDGHRALQVTRGEVKRSRLTKPELGHFAKANVEPGRGLWEFRLKDNEYQDVKIGDEFGIDLFDEGQFVDVTSTSKGRGFSGVVRRWNFQTQDATHGNSLSHRAPGSIGQCQTPGRVFKGKKMAGQYGNKRTTIQNQQIVRVDKDRNFMLLKGNVPGAPGSNVLVLPAIKKAAPPVKAVLREAKAAPVEQQVEQAEKAEEKAGESN